ncbi:MAG: OmpP1/FadL family transporter [Candidatus Sedimenticola sp. 20ELBAFRAG]
MIRTRSFALNTVAAACGLALMTAGQAQAGGWKLPENSINGTALSAAYVANASGADSSYYNPASMVFSDDPRGAFEADLTVVHISGTEFSAAGFPNDEGKTETIPVPSFHYISPAMGDVRYGLSVVTPGGLTKRWKGVGKTFAEEFTLKTVEFNPTISYKVNDQFSLGGGLRAIYSEGVVKSTDQGPLLVGYGVSPARNMEGDSWDFGYNLALHFKPNDDLKLSATYRSKIDLTEEGTATLSDATATLPTITTAASVTVPIPAALSLAAAFDVNDSTTFEVVLERTYWSEYKQLDFSYPASIGGYTAFFDAPSDRNWKDTNTLRLGLTHKLNSQWTVMAGLALDETPAPKNTIGFELPDSDAKIISLGAKYEYSDDLTIGAAFLYDQKDKLTITAADGNSTFAGGAEFKDSAAYLFTAGLEYRF